MAYTNFDGKIILHRYGVVQVTLAEEVEAGQMITRTGYLADAEGSKAAELVACEHGIAAAVIWAALAVEIKKAPTRSGAVWTRGDHSGTAGTLLYLDGGADEGEACESAGTIAQGVGWVTSQDTAFICPMSYLTGVNIAASGTCTVTGNSTFGGTVGVTGLLTATGGLTVATGKDLTMVKGNIIFTKGGVQRYVRAVTATDTILVNDDILLVSPAADTVLTLPDLATAGIGKSFTIIHKATANTIEVDAAGTDKILGVNGTATYVKLTDDKGIDVRFTVRAVASALWMVTEVSGDVTAA